MSTPDIVIYAGPDAEVALPPDPERETVWASQTQIVDLFGISVSTVSRHIRNTFEDAEIARDSNLQKCKLLFDETGAARISNNALAAITLMVAMCEPREKDLMIALLTRMLAEEGR